MLFTVFGSPISHSLSPLIHQEFARQFNLDITYTKTLSTPLEFPAQLIQFKNNHGIGANITAPLKEHAFTLCDQLSPRAQLAESVNTIYWKQNKNILIGDNTDGIGFERDVYQNQSQCFEGQNILILGAGGAASGILPTILKHQPCGVYIYNRTRNRAELLCSKFNQIQSQVQLKIFHDLNNIQFDWIINTAGQFDLTENLISQKQKFMGAKFFDLSYAQFELTPFLKSIQAFSPSWSRDGLGMLAEQAAESFYIWHQCKPETSIVLKSIRGNLLI